MRVQRIEWHSYKRVYEFEVPDEDIIKEYDSKENFLHECENDEDEIVDWFEEQEYEPDDIIEWHYSVEKGGYEVEYNWDEECVDQNRGMSVI